MLVTTAVAAIMLAIPAYIYQTVIPENRLISSTLAHDIGSRFEGNGVFPQNSTLYREDIGQNLGLQLGETASGQLTNRWGQTVEVKPVLLGHQGSKNSLFLELTVTSSGPFGLIGPVSVSRMYEYVYASDAISSTPESAAQFDE